MKEPVTLDAIMSWCKLAVQERRPISPGDWLDICQKLAVLIEDVDDQLIESEMEYRGIRAEFLSSGESAAAAETKAKSSNAYKMMLGLKAKRERVAWTIQIAKKRADIKSFEKLQ